MFRSRWLQALYSLGLEFWLPLPLWGLFFWAGCGMLSDRMLNRSLETPYRLQANMRQEQPLKRVLSIKVAINKSQGFSKVKVKKITRVLQEIEFQLPVTESSQVEAVIGQELRLSPAQIRNLVHYQVEERRVE